MRYNDNQQIMTFQLSSLDFTCFRPVSSDLAVLKGMEPIAHKSKYSNGLNFISLSYEES